MTNITKPDSEESWRLAWSYIKSAADMLSQPLLILDSKLGVIAANKEFYKFFETTPALTENIKMQKLGKGEWDIPKLQELLSQVAPKGKSLEGYKVNQTFPRIGRKALIINSCKIYRGKDDRPITLLAMEDVTEIEELQASMVGHAEKLEASVAERTKELDLRIKELERINKIMVERELKMVELKKEIEHLKK